MSIAFKLHEKWVRRTFDAFVNWKKAEINEYRQKIARKMSLAHLSRVFNWKQPIPKIC